MRGPQPTPTHLKLLAGNPGKRRINRNEPVPIGPAVMPPHLSRLEAEEWARTIRAMPPGFYTAADEPVLAIYVGAWALHRQAFEEIARDGMTSTGAAGQVIAHPMLVTLARQAEIILRTADRLGLCPAARSWLEAPRSERGKFDGLLGGREPPPAA